jgi:hypothetical protein
LPLLSALPCRAQLTPVLRAPLRSA